MGKLIFLICFLLAVIGCDLEKKSFEINVTGDVLVFRAHEEGAFLQGEERALKSIMTLKEGEKLKILDSYQGKDYLAYKIKTANGVEGFVIHGDSFIVNRINLKENGP